ncbi:MAG: FIST C-terminal domain-containing protein, partial [Betaproteobacteria bacterium]
GVNINGSARIDGMTAQLGAAVPIAGGLAGDDGAFQKTYTLCNQGVSCTRLVAVGLKGEALQFARGSFGGWKPFGRARRVTRSANNVLYELDGEPALEIYKRYLGEHAKDLPGSGLLFPFEMLGDAREPTGLIRTILGVNEADGSMTLAGAISQGGYLRLMHAQTDSLVDGAQEAARATLRLMAQPTGAGLALLVSCVGRKLLMGGRVDEETEIVHTTLGAQATLAGFYSYGEIGPGPKILSCQLHNQTMTISYLSETAG